MLSLSFLGRLDLTFFSLMLSRYLPTSRVRGCLGAGIADKGGDHDLDHLLVMLLYIRRSWFRLF